MEQNSALTQELIGLEKKYWSAMEKRDLNSAIELTDFPCLVAGPHGSRLVDQAQFTEMFNSNEKSTLSAEIQGEPQVRILSENSAVIAYKVRSKMTSPEKNETLDAVDTSTWVRKNGRWTCAHHTETPLQRQ